MSIFETLKTNKINDFRSLLIFVAEELEKFHLH